MGEGTGLSFLGDQTAPPACPLKTEFLHKLFVFSVQLLQGAACHSTRRVSSPSPASPCSALSLTFPSLFCWRPVYYQHVAHVLDKSRGPFTIGVGQQCQPRTPYFSLSPLFSLTLPSLIHPSSLNIELPG